MITKTLEERSVLYAVKIVFEIGAFNVLSKINIGGFVLLPLAYLSAYNYSCNAIEVRLDKHEYIRNLDPEITCENVDETKIINIILY